MGDFFPIFLTSGSTEILIESNFWWRMYVPYIRNRFKPRLKSPFRHGCNVGTIYEGELRDGMFHGQGSLYWPKSHQRLDVVHLRGELQEYRYIFPDGLSYEDKDWSYCTFPDRR